ncbi:Ig-like domain-containing protein [Colwellia sp. 1_MG-2023]|uniref:Ig-like domain-containing protein n=1 Tax=unclassified Colwellia TaxID=196834 RepID=UPI001C083BDC|nr:MULTISPECIES: Ig-like domain-containing protein [unclassified Colwellia]MBU2924262.1 Ig-like domain-containing protein [Colwellia sp. C2M11]MDO6652971.1 Ig-like domain-containing protein [Colwellia sp. 3_MG-2023]MDO6665453.1 Ig-like domain-containing protein [Colwellia sp. 2_MG-2023]MDO6689788.1 Ig-like domain-containing protein [Colwellia sp. 1_MG-2023]
MKLKTTSLLGLSTSILLSTVSQADEMVLPLSDPENNNGWVFNETFSDEFNGNTLDETKWYALGETSNYWKGRGAQYAPHNVRIEDGKLKIKTQWEPDFDFAEGYKDMTSAGIIHHKSFLYGYMEVKVKVPDAPMSGSFWFTGEDSELDVFEHFGKVTKVGGNKAPESRIWTSIHDWRIDRPEPQSKNKIYYHQYPLGFRVAEKFATYGIEWTEDSYTVYLEGKKLYSAQQGPAGCANTNDKTNLSANGTPLDCLGDKWLLNNRMDMWFDSEVFDWMGVPTQQDLSPPVDFEVEYVRVWQKPNNYAIDKAFFGFEGAIAMNGKDIFNLAKPEKPGAYRKRWAMSDANMAITGYPDFKYSTGRKSLKISHTNGLTADIIATSPQGSIETTAGNYLLSFDVFVENNSSIKDVTIKLGEPESLHTFDISSLPRERWITVTENINRASSSGVNDNMQVIIDKSAAAQGNSTIYIDNIMLDKITGDFVNITDIKTENNATIAVGETLQLAIEVTPTSASNQYINWHSSDETKAYVNNRGKLFALAAGTVDIVATAVNGKQEETVVVIIDGDTELSVEQPPSSSDNIDSTPTPETSVVPENPIVDEIPNEAINTSKESTAGAMHWLTFLFPILVFFLRRRTEI